MHLGGSVVTNLERVLMFLKGDNWEYSITELCLR